MSVSRRICILYLPSPWNGAWLSALEQAARRAGWAFIDACRSGPQETHQMDALIVSFDVAAARRMDPSEWYVLLGDPAEVLHQLEDERANTQTQQQNLWEASHRLAAAASVAAEGAGILDANASSLTVPHLGEIHRDGAYDPPLERLTELFDPYWNLPVSPAAVFRIPTALWLSGDGQEPNQNWVDLTGRGRMIVGFLPIDLLPGRWQAEVRLSCDPEGGVIPLRWEWGAEEQKSAGVFRLDKAGRYLFVVENYLSSQSSVTGQLVLSYPLFQGRIKIDDISIHYIG